MAVKVGYPSSFIVSLIKSSLTKWFSHIPNERGIGNVLSITIFIAEGIHEHLKEDKDLKHKKFLTENQAKRSSCDRFFSNEGFGYDKCCIAHERIVS